MYVQNGSNWSFWAGAFLFVHAGGHLLQSQVLTVQLGSAPFNLGTDRRQEKGNKGTVCLSSPGGELITNPFRFSGENLFLNYSTSAAGSIHVEIQDINGNPAPGLSLTESVPIRGDELEGKAGWIYGGKVSEKPLRRVAGKTVRLRFVLKDADLYSFRFR